MPVQAESSSGTGGRLACATCGEVSLGLKHWCARLVHLPDGKAWSALLQRSTLQNLRGRRRRPTSLTWSSGSASSGCSREAGRATHWGRGFSLRALKVRGSVQGARRRDWLERLLGAQIAEPHLPASGRLGLVDGGMPLLTRLLFVACSWTQHSTKAVNSEAAAALLAWANHSDELRELKRSLLRRDDISTDWRLHGCLLGRH